MLLHPMLVHFPIALLIVAGGLYIFSHFRPAHAYARSAELMHLLGLLGIGLAILSGNQAADGLDEGGTLGQLLDRHELLSYILLWFYGMLYLWSYLRKGKQLRWEQILFTSLFVLGLSALVYTSFLGGQMAHEW